MSTSCVPVEDVEDNTVRRDAEHNYTSNNDAHGHMHFPGNIFHQVTMVWSPKRV